jgi:hypothetical protein
MTADAKAMDTSVTLDELRAAWANVKNDNSPKLRERQVFVTIPAMVEAYDKHFETWAPELAERWAGERVPLDRLRPVEVPKPGFHIRPGGYLGLEDQLLYHVAAMKVLPLARKRLAWSDGTVDLSYKLSNPPSTDLFDDPKKGWANFSRASEDLATGKAKFVVVSDIAGYYENISLKRLADILDECGIDVATRRRISKLLNQWADPNERGIPQGPSPSALFAKLYLDPMDRELQAAGVTHLRYADDIRLFCPDELSARRALRTLHAAVRRLGLILQTAKTEIVSADAFLADSRGISKRVEDANKKLAEDLKAHLQEDLKYATAEEVAEVLAKHGPEIDLKALQSVLASEFPIEGRPDFDKRVFHFVLNRLGWAGDESAVDVCVAYLTTHPEETPFIVQHFGVLPRAQARVCGLLSTMILADALDYDYQLYMVCEFLRTHGCPCEGVRRAMERILGNAERLPYVRATAMACLGRLGIEDSIRRWADRISGLDPCVQFTLAASLRLLPAQKRTELLSRWGEVRRDLKWAGEVG